MTVLFNGAVIVDPDEIYVTEAQAAESASRIREFLEQAAADEAGDGIGNR